MTNGNRHLPFHRSSHRATATIAAGLLILGGTMLQLGETSFGGPTVDNLWYISVILNTIGRTLQMCFTSALLQDAFGIWSLALVIAGVAMLLSAKRTGSPRVPDGERNA